MDRACHDHIVRRRFEYLEVDSVNLWERTEQSENRIFGIGYQLTFKRLRLAFRQVVCVPRMNMSGAPPDLQAIADSQLRQAVASHLASKVKSECATDIPPVPGSIHAPEDCFYRIPHSDCADFELRRFCDPPAFVQRFVSAGCRRYCGGTPLRFRSSLFGGSHLN